MGGNGFVIWMVLAALTGLQGQSQGTNDKVVGEVARFYRSGQTLVNGFVRVPHRLLSGVTGAGGFAVYSVELRVMDQRGTVLTHGFHAPEELERVKAVPRAEEDAEEGGPSAAPSRPAGGGALAALEERLAQALEEITQLRARVERFESRLQTIEQQQGGGKSL